MENINTKQIGPEVFDCAKGHRVLLFKDNMPRNNECECWCLACGTPQIVKKNNSSNNIIYTHKNAFELLNSLYELRDEFLTYYYDNENNIEKAVTMMNGNYNEEKPKVLTKNKTIE